MSKKNILLKKVEGIYDIQPPLEPSLSFLQSSLLLLGLVIVISSVCYIVWRLFYSHKKRNKRKIKALQKAYIENNISIHETIYSLCFYLRQGLKLNYLGVETILPTKLVAHEKQWLKFINTLSDLRYKNNKQAGSNMDEIFNESLFWLRNWP